MVLLALSLYELTLGFLALLALVVILIILVLIYGYRNFKLLRNVQQWRRLIEDKVVFALFNGVSSIKDDEDLRKHLGNREFQKIFVSVLIDSEQRFSGEAHGVLVEIFYAFKIDDIAWRNLESSKTSLQVQGIQVLTALRVQEALPKIQQLLQHADPRVVTEAQYASVRFLGSRGLMFLKDFTFHMSRWQQLRLLHAIKVMPEESYEYVSYGLHHSNITVVDFALAIIRKFKLLSFHDAVCALLQHPKEAIRIYAILTIQSLENERTIKLMMDEYGQQPQNVKLALLSMFKKSRNKIAIPLLREELQQDQDPRTLLYAAEALAALQEEPFLEELKRKEPHNMLIHQVVDHALAVKL